MGKIQFLSLTEANYECFDCNTIDTPFALDSYEVNIFDLSNSDVFNCLGSDYIGADKVEIKSSLLNIKDMIKNSSKSTQIILLPTNINVYYRYSSYCRQLKNELRFMCSFLSYYLFAPSDIEVGYEPNKTSILNDIAESDFYFKNQDLTSATKALDTDKITTIKVNNNIYLTFLKLDTLDKIYSFLYKLNLIQKGSTYPKWLVEYSFNDDEQLNIRNQQYHEQIENIELKINDNNRKLEQNLHLKSVLVENGSQLVNVVFEILQELLGEDLSHFVDEKKEDILFKHKSITYIGEIKGITSGIGNANISQVDNHKSLYEDKLQNEGAPQETIKKILIINDQRNKPLEEREPIHQNQITKAVKENVLIIRTSDLLNILEKYRQTKITRDEIFNMLENQSGPIKY